MMPLLDIFLEVWKIKIGNIKFEMDEVEVKGIKKKVKSTFKTCKRISKDSKLKDEMLEFPKEELKNYSQIMFELEPKFKEIKKEEVCSLSQALVAVYEFLNIMFT